MLRRLREWWKHSFWGRPVSALIGTTLRTQQEDKTPWLQDGVTPSQEMEWSERMFDEESGRPRPKAVHPTDEAP